MASYGVSLSFSPIIAPDRVLLTAVHTTRIKLGVLQGIGIDIFKPFFQGCFTGLILLPKESPIMSLCQSPQ
jgi:hypothetical protein